MKLSNTNNTFKGIYKHSFNYKKEPLKAYVLPAFAKQENADLIYNSRGYDMVHYILEYALQNKHIHSMNWFLKHAELKGFELPSYMTKGEIDAYLLTGEDKIQYEKFEIKKERSYKVLRKAFKNNIKKAKSKGDDSIFADILAKAISDFDKIEQEKFNEFLENKKINPMKIDIVI